MIDVLTLLKFYKSKQSLLLPTNKNNYTAKRTYNWIYSGNYEILGANETDQPKWTVLTSDPYFKAWLVNQWVMKVFLCMHLSLIVNDLKEYELSS